MTDEREGPAAAIAALPPQIPLRSLTPHEAVRCWDEVALGYSREEAMAEAQRVRDLDFTASVARCPFEIDIPRFIGQIADGNFDAALATIRESHPFAGTFGRHCHKYCEFPFTGERRMATADPTKRAPVISALERAAGDHGIRKPADFRPGAPTGRRVALVGAGSAALMCAWELRRMGHAVDIFERDIVTAGLLRTGYPSFRMSKPMVIEEHDPTEWGAALYFGHPIDGPELARMVEEYDAVFVGIGRTPVVSLGVEGDELEGVITGLDFLRGQWLGPAVPIGRRVIVVGGGFTALDVTRAVLRRGSEATLAYRRGIREVSGGAHFARILEEEGATLRFFLEPVRVIGEEGHVVAVDMARTELGEPIAGGVPDLRRIPNTEERIPVDTVIRCIGETIEAGWVEEAVGIRRTPTGLIEVDPVTKQTANPKVWSGGDSIGSRGNETAAYDGLCAARAMDATFRGELSAWRVQAEPLMKDMRFW
ncbi:MAG: glutamate synthase small chain [Chloroflexota bacterium]|nr:glutamate synthase small chain [Chloroflexota bacterium]